MFHSIVGAALVGSALLCASMPVSAQVATTYTFADGTADGWVSFNGASAPVASSAAAYSGSSFSLLTTTNSSGAGGPSVSLNGVLLAGAQYTITGWVQLTGGEVPSNANFTIKRSDPSCSGGTCYDTVGSFEVAVSSSGWAQIGGSYTVSATETGLTIDFASCESNARFRAKAPWSSATYDTGKLETDMSQ
jgi:endo-1,4-beta-xylanase